MSNGGASDQAHKYICTISPALRRFNNEDCQRDDVQVGKVPMTKTIQMIPAMPQNTLRIALVLPAYNEELTISATIRTFHEHLPEAAIFVVNNNSRDGTAECAWQTFRELSCKGDVIDEWRQGKGNALRRAFFDIDADIYVLADADLTYPADRVRDLIAPVLENRADMVVGDRHSGGHYAKENHRPLHGIGNRIVQATVNALFNARLVDIMSGYRVFNRTFVRNYPILVEGFQVETDMTLHALH